MVMWLSGLHIPESYLTAMVQTTCRLKNWPLDKSTLYTVVTKYVDPGSVRHTAPLGALRTHDTPKNRKGARAMSQPLSVADSSVICFRLQLHTKLESGCYINGMYLEGAAWDLRNSCLRR